MIKYNSTLNLPKTEFPMRGNLIKNELKILLRWKKDNIYKVIRNAKKGKKIFFLHDGPPYANGNIHIGHALNKILKDIIIKSKSLSGFDSPYIPGWDCHGLPTELKVEQKYGKPNEILSDNEFRLKCREYVTKQINNQRKDFIRLGVIGDWKNPYLTMDFKIEANIIRTLGKIISNQYFQKGIKPVHWCISCSSTLAEAEVEYYNKIALSIYVEFTATDQNFIKNKFNLSNFNDPISLVIWTTNPWTLTANRAVAISSKFKYVFVKTNNKILILAEALVKSIMHIADIRQYTIIGSFNNKDLEFVYFKHPFLNFNVPVVFGEHVTLDSGTGIVHIAGGHGLDDYNISLKYGLDVSSQIGQDGKYLPGTYHLLDGLNIFDANKIIINILRDNNKLINILKINHSYPYCWRHKTPTIFRTTPQWFIGMDQKELREKSLNEIKKVEWIPKWGESRIRSMILNHPDWCISRQRTWGVPISIFVHKETKELHPRTLEIIEEVAKLVEVNGVQAWWDLEAYDIIGNDADSYEKITDILDVWFDAGSTHYSVVDFLFKFDKESSFVYLEGSDQHRGWFMSSLIISTAIKGKAPYNQVLTHGFAVDSKGRKMSKSIGNIVPPIDIINKFGADVLRLWVASTDYTGEMVVSEEILKKISNDYRRIRNTMRFMLANLNGFNPSEDIVNPKEMILLDLWAIDCAKKTQENIIYSYNSYEFHKVVKLLLHFCSIEMGSFYLDIIKDRQYTSKKDSLARRSCQTAIYHIVEALVRWIAPIISFTADEIWNYLPGKHNKYVFTEEWYEGLFNASGMNLIDCNFWNDIINVRKEVNKIIEQARKDEKIGGSLEAEVILYAEPKLASKLIALNDELKFFLLTSNAKVYDYDLATSIDAKQSKSIKGLKIMLIKAIGKKCLRCWHYTNDIGLIKEYSDICLRCVSNITDDGEIRRFI